MPSHAAAHPATHAGKIHRPVADGHRSRQAGEVHHSPRPAGHRAHPPGVGHYKLTELRPEHFRNFYAELRKVIRPDTKKPLSEYTIEGVHATLCSILSDAVEGGFLSHNPAWRTYRYTGRKCEKKIADEETAQKIIAALEGESIKYETYFKLIIATGMRRASAVV